MFGEQAINQFSWSTRVVYVGIEDWESRNVEGPNYGAGELITELWRATEGEEQIDQRKMKEKVVKEKSPKVLPSYGLKTKLF